MNFAQFHRKREECDNVLRFVGSTKVDQPQILSYPFLEPLSLSNNSQTSVSFFQSQSWVYNEHAVKH